MLAGNGSRESAERRLAGVLTRAQPGTGVRVPMCEKGLYGLESHTGDKGQSTQIFLENKEGLQPGSPADTELTVLHSSWLLLRPTVTQRVLYSLPSAAIVHREDRSGS